VYILILWQELDLAVFKKYTTQYRRWQTRTQGKSPYILHHTLYYYYYYYYYIFCSPRLHSHAYILYELHVYTALKTCRGIVFHSSPPPEGFAPGRVTTIAAAPVAVTLRADTMIYRAVRKDTRGISSNGNQVMVGRGWGTKRVLTRPTSRCTLGMYFEPNRTITFFKILFLNLKRQLLLVLKK